MSSATPAADVFEDQGVLWKQDPGGTSTFEELLAARSFFIDTYQDALWNPWVTDDNKAELDAAMVTIREWTRAGPDFRQWTAEETEAYLDEGRRAREAERAETEARWEHDKTRFDPELFAARRSLLEQESLQLHFQSELEEFRSGRRYPAMAQEKREKAIADLEVKLARCNESLLRLRRTVGDPELVVNERGQLPRDRREANRLWFKFDREREVRALRERLPCLRSELKASTDKEQRKDLRAKVARDDAELTYWLGISPLTVEEMCSECATPLVGHGWVSVGLHGAHPCPAWPGWAARIEKARKMFFEMVERNREPSPPPTPKPEPIATIPSGLPVAEVVARLSELQALHPDAVVKRGRANRWELWPPSD